MAFILGGEPFWLTCANERALRGHRPYRPSGHGDTLSDSLAGPLLADGNGDANPNTLPDRPDLDTNPELCERPTDERRA